MGQVGDDDVAGLRSGLKSLDLLRQPAGAVDAQNRKAGAGHQVAGGLFAEVGQKEAGVMPTDGDRLGKRKASAQLGKADCRGRIGSEGEALREAGAPREEERGGGERGWREG